MKKEHEKTGDQLHREYMAKYYRCADEHDEIDIIINKIKEMLSENNNSISLKESLAQAMLEKYKLGELSRSRLNPKSNNHRGVL